MLRGENNYQNEISFAFITFFLLHDFYCFAVGNDKKSGFENQ